MDTVESEWDKKVVRVLLGGNLSRTSIDKLGFNSDKLAKSTREVLEVSEQWQNTLVAGEDLAKSRLEKKLPGYRKKLMV
jgi:hypothetical protein